MAHRLGVMGEPNTGKSFSRRSIKHVEKCLVISPSSKHSHLMKDEKQVSKLKVTLTLKDGSSYNGYPTMNRLVESGQLPEGSKLSVTGNRIIEPDVKKITTYLKFVDKFMPHINVVFLADFTHFMSKIISSETFQKRSSGGQAFQRYLDLAVDSLNNCFLVVDELQRDDLIIVSEFHVQLKDEDGYYDVFLTAGKMLNDAFLPKSYFDHMLCTTVLDYEENEKGDNETTRYKFVVNKQKPFDARCAGLFDNISIDGMIPNDMRLVLNKIFKDIGEDVEV